MAWFVTKGVSNLSIREMSPTDYTGALFSMLHKYYISHIYSYTPQPNTFSLKPYLLSHFVPLLPNYGNPDRFKRNQIFLMRIVLSRQHTPNKPYVTKKRLQCHSISVSIPSLIQAGFPRRDYRVR